MAYIPFGIGKCYELHKEKLAKNNCNRSQCKTHWRRKVVVYLQKHSVNSFYKFKLIFSDFIPSLYHSLMQASRCMCTGGLPKIRADKHHQLSHPRFLCWVALVVVREWVLSRPAVPSPASSFYSAVFCLWILLTWCFMNLRWLFSPIICIFPFWVSSSSASLGTGGRSQVWPSGHPPALRAWVFLWQVTSAGPQLSAGLEGCKQHLSHFYCC